MKIWLTREHLKVKTQFSSVNAEVRQVMGKILFATVIFSIALSAKCLAQIGVERLGGIPANNFSAKRRALTYFHVRNASNRQLQFRLSFQNSQGKTIHFSERKIVNPGETATWSTRHGVRRTRVPYKGKDGKTYYEMKFVMQTIGREKSGREHRWGSPMRGSERVEAINKTKSFGDSIGGRLSGGHAEEITHRYHVNSSVHLR